MYDFLLSVQFIGIWLIFIVIAYVYGQTKTKIQTLLLMLGIATMINTAGYWMEMQATNKETALLAVKFIYLGKPFIILSLLFLLIAYFNVPVSRKIKNVFFAIHVGISFLVMTCEKNDLFYSTIEFTNDGLFPHLVLGHGIFYVLYTVLMGGYAVYMFYLLIKYADGHKQKNERWQIGLLYSMLINGILGIVLFFLGITGGYDTTALAYLINVILMCIAMAKYRLINPIDIAKDRVLEQITDGFIVTDNHNNLLYYNGIVEKIFPKVKAENEAAWMQFMKDLEVLIKSDVYYVSDYAYKISSKKLENDGIALGNLYIIKDITDSNNYAIKLENEIEEKTRKVQMMQRNITLGLADTIEIREWGTEGHIRRTSDVVGIFVKKLSVYNRSFGLSKEFCDNIVNAAPMYDIGKLYIEDSILNKSGKYTPDEYERMKTHAQRGALIIEYVLKDIDDEAFRKVAVNMAYYHHERWDGTGYPEGRKAEDIPIEARIMAFADVFDALVTKRCYKEKMSFEQAFFTIQTSMGTQFDEKLGRCFLECRKELEEYYSQIKEA